jgi:hypothetical protein
MEVHRCAFFEYVPSAVHALAYHPDGTRVAVARMDADIEIWRAQDDWLLERVRAVRPPTPPASL